MEFWNFAEHRILDVETALERYGGSVSGFYEFGLFMLAMPAHDPRYILGAIECGMFFGVYGVFVRKVERL